MADIETVWSRIVAHKREVFQLIKGEEFTYEISGNTIKPNRVNRQIPKSNIEKALPYLPFDTTTEPTRLDLQAPAYVYAILMDSRIRQSDW